MSQQVDDTNSLSSCRGRSGGGITSSSGVVVSDACTGRSSIGRSSNGRGSRAGTKASHGQ